MKSFLSKAIYFQIAQISHRAQKLQHKSVQGLDPSCASLSGNWEEVLRVNFHFSLCPSNELINIAPEYLKVSRG